MQIDPKHRQGFDLLSDTVHQYAPFVTPAAELLVGKNNRRGHFGR